MDFTIQHLVFPTETKHLQCRELFYRGDQGYYDADAHSLTLGRGQFVDFVSYINACSYAKWLRYTRAGALTLHLDVEGSFNLKLVGYHRDQCAPMRVDFSQTHYDLSKRKTLDLTFPENNEMMVGFELTCAKRCVIYGGHYTVRCAESDLNEVNLCIATTTCRKEDFITGNVDLIKRELLTDDSIREHLFVHVVDNGRTLTEAQINGYHVFLHPNNNAGGSGGYARGMIESLHQVPKATHVLLMDDDVLILPDSLLRTYALLRLQREEYRDHFISGAMLFYEKPYKQHEDIGTVSGMNEFISRKRKLDHREIRYNLENEDDYIRQPNEYCGWWYCCIPTSVIETWGLPLPIFIRCDDAEYSLRCGARIITMNGICIWHMGFERKYTGSMDLYQQWRNQFINQACSGVPRGVDFDHLFHNTFRMQLLKYDYNSAELMLRALEDYMKGPDFLKEDRGESILKENSKLNAHMETLSNFPQVAIRDEFSCFDNTPRTFIHTLLYRLTFNGHILWPEKWLKDTPGIMSFNFTYDPERITLCRQHIAVNPYTKSGCVYTIDKKRFRELYSRYQRMRRDYKQRKEAILASYKAEEGYLKSEAFWRKYLKLDL